MVEFVCRMALPTGEIVERVMTAADEGALRRELEDKDYLILDLRRRSSLAAMLGGLALFRPGVSAREFLFFNQEFSALVRAGLPILTSLDILIERRANPVFKRALQDVRDRVRSGESLSDAFAAQGDLFPKLYASSLASGERSGEIPSVLRRYIAYTKSLLTIRKKVVSASIYPLILIGVSAVLVAIMVFYVLPSFSGFLKELGTDLPVATEMIMAFALFCKSQAFVILGSVVAAVVGIVAWKRSGAGRTSFDRIKVRFPLLGAIAHQYAQNRFTRTLGTLVAGGIPLVTSLELAARAVGNAWIETKLMDVTRQVREGHSLWESLEKTGEISDITIEMVKVGESTGALVEMLDSASDFAEEEIDYKLGKMITFVEPALLIFMALVVTGMLLAFYLPLIRAAGSSRF